MKKNILITFTHASYYVPFYMRLFMTDYMKKDNNRLLKNYSDFGTLFLSENIPDENKVVCNFSRSIGDPNRDLNNPDLFRMGDFNNISVWKFNLPNFIKKYLINNYYKKYHTEIRKKIDLLKEKYGSVIHLDIHDTGNLLMGRNIEEDKLKKDYFPEVNILNIENKSCDLKLAEKIGKLFKKEFGYESNIDNPFGGGGFVTRKYGIDDENVNGVRIELGRYIFLDEKTQEINLEKMSNIRDKFEKVLIQL